MKIYIGADHEGFEYRNQLAQALNIAGHQVVDVGNEAIDVNDDYTQFAAKLAAELRADQDPEARGILISGNGQGICMAANRFNGIRASLCWNALSARSARSDDDSNVLCLSSRFMSLDECGSIMVTWLATPFEANPNQTRRIQQLDGLSTSNG